MAAPHTPTTAAEEAELLDFLRSQRTESAGAAPAVMVLHRILVDRDALRDEVRRAHEALDDRDYSDLGRDSLAARIANLKSRFEDARYGDG
jgi:hypothetical protein